MSDLITHLGAGYLAARALGVRDPRPLLVGSVLPDISTALWKVPGVLGWYHPLMFPYLESFGTPFVLLFLGAGVAFLARRPGPALGGIYGGCALHLALDLTPKGAGGELLLYPWSMREFSLDLYWMDGAFANSLMAVCAVVLAWALFHWPREPFFAIGRTGRWHAIAAACLATAFVIPAFTTGRYYSENVCNMRFWDEPERYRGQVVELAFDMNEGKDPRAIKGIRFDTPEPMRMGYLVWLRGECRNRTFHVLEMRNVDKRTKEYGSAVGLAAFLFAFAVPRGGTRGRSSLLPFRPLRTMRPWICRDPSSRSSASWPSLSPPAQAPAPRSTAPAPGR